MDFIEQENNNNNNGNNQNDLNYQKEQQQQQQRTITTTTNDNNNDNNNRNDFNTIGFACQMDSTKAIASTIAGIHNGKKDHHVLVRAFEGSVTFLTHDKGQNMQGQATLLNSSFSHFEQFKTNNKNDNNNNNNNNNDDDDDDDEEEEEPIEFKVNLNTLIQCLSIFGAANMKTTSLRMDYNDSTNQFRLILQHGTDALTECAIQTLIDDVQLANYFLAFGESDAIGEIIVLSESLRDAFSEIYSMPGAASVNLLLSQEAPFFQLVAVGNNGRCEIEFPNGSESFSSFTCKVPRIHFRYQLSLLQNALKALNDSTQTFLRINGEGMLCLQHKLHHNQNELSFVEFIVLPEENDEKEGDEDEDYNNVNSNRDVDNNDRTAAIVEDNDDDDGEGERYEIRNNNNDHEEEDTFWDD